MIVAKLLFITYTFMFQIPEYLWLNQDIIIISVVLL